MKAYTNKPYFPDINKYKKYVDKIYQSGWLTNNGPLAGELKDRLKDYLKVQNLVLFANATLALQFAYRLLNLEGKVITTPFSFVATSSSLVWEGLEPLFVDIDSESLNIDIDKIESSIDDRVTGILPVHIFGNPCDVEKIDKLASKHKLKVLYDAAQAFGVKYKDNSVLNYGDISVVSFHGTKLFHTIEGGAIITDDDEIAEKARNMTNFGITGPGTIDYLGLNAKMNEFEAAMGLCVLDDIDYIFEKRQEISYIYKKELEGIVGLQKTNPQSDGAYGYFPVIFDHEEQLERAQNQLTEHNIVPRRYFRPSLDTLNYVQCNEEMNISRDISKRVLCLPIYPGLEPETIQLVIQIIKKEV
ncbi:MAG: DegT/DnrJ/EryC1/StrS family aminotransferase [Spirochaetota bacterium]|nr:DegT/DnrJ/EryC1/StrS family aminotransferase [Spirochaetota bacterium]